MSAKHALLGLLLEGDAYPYQLADRLQARLGPAWAINSGQISQTVRKAEEEGLVQQVERPGSPHRRRRVLAITDSGAQEYERWFSAEPCSARLAKRPLLVKLTLAGPTRLEEALRQIDAYQRACTERLREIASLAEEVPAEGLRVRADHVLLRLCLSADTLHLEAELRWASNARAVVTWLQSQEAVWPSRAERGAASSAEARQREAARQQLFGRMAARHLQGLDEKPEDR